VLDKERSENECLHQHCGSPRSKLWDSFAIILSRIDALLSIVLLIIVNHLWSLWRWFAKFTKTAEIKPTLVWRGGGGAGVGDTHFTGNHIGGIHVSLGICVREYTYHGDTHITVTPVWPSPSWFKDKGGSYFLITLRANWIRPDSFGRFLSDLRLRFCLRPRFNLDNLSMIVSIAHDFWHDSDHNFLYAKNTTIYDLYSFCFSSLI